MMKEGLLLRPAGVADVPLVLDFIRELAAYERLEKDVVATKERLEATLFGPGKLADVLLAFREEQPAGFAVYFHQFSTFKAAPVLYLEDLFVKPEFRGRGIGRAMLERLLDDAEEKGCCRMQWSVLNWNHTSMEFYQRLGAKALKEWVRYGIDLPRKGKKNPPGRQTQGEQK